MTNWKFLTGIFFLVGYLLAWHGKRRQQENDVQHIQCQTNPREKLVDTSHPHGEEKCPFIEDNQFEEGKRLTKREKVRLLIVAYAASMEEELTCSVCFELFVVKTPAPKEFYCAHVICEICMKPLLSSG